MYCLDHEPSTSLLLLYRDILVSFEQVQNEAVQDAASGRNKSLLCSSSSVLRWKGGAERNGRKGVRHCLCLHWRDLGLFGVIEGHAQEYSRIFHRDECLSFRPKRSGQH